jgi:beta-N-acetylhexosaminidase
MEPILTWVVDDIVAAVADGRLPAERLADAAARVEALVTAVRSGTLPPMREAGSAPVIADASQQAARAALRVHGTVTHLDPKNVLVLEFHVTPGIAAGEVPWTLPLNDARRRSLSPADDRAAIDAVLSTVGEQSLVALVRDAHRHPWVGDRLEQIARARPDLVTVETGWPVVDAEGTPTGLPGAATIWTYGGSSVSLQAAAEWLGKEMGTGVGTHAGTDPGPATGAEREPDGIR